MEIGKFNMNVNVDIFIASNIIMDNQKQKDLWEREDLIGVKDCDNCKWRDEALENDNDGYAPCRRCIRWDGER